MAGDKGIRPKVTAARKGYAAHNVARKSARHLPLLAVSADEPSGQDTAARYAQYVRYRRKRALMSAVRFAAVVLVPTAIVAWYMAVIATPLYTATTDFMLQQIEQAPPDHETLQTAHRALDQDIDLVKAHLQSRATRRRLDVDTDFHGHWSQGHVDPLNRLRGDLSEAGRHRAYTRRVSISSDPETGLIQVQVRGVDPESALQMSEQLVDYARSYVRLLTAERRADLTRDALHTYQQARHRIVASRARLDFVRKQFEPAGTDQVTRNLSAPLFGEMDAADEIGLDPNKLSITNMQNVIADLRPDWPDEVTARNPILKMAETDLRQDSMALHTAVIALEQQRRAALREHLCLSVGLQPVVRAWSGPARVAQSSVLAFLIFGGLYMVTARGIPSLRQRA
ncbi:hypothetical protein [Actibacterium sp. 188UL27-1]|uniref:hypothetical protein n=1 Tax=Actibacterium sp. 188UL27-1 TaxID=2786961 RepID=UPI0019575343|nr:hypothetical protein [Actibacterium sp. 188UL27-1]MBM7068098.1 hypothetical protein [Actibacterium sp. 188UL27-1]